ncbi:MAG: carbon-nitrogen hydrolase family protein [Candidatus Aenigmatarchaeota archaeon]
MKFKIAVVQFKINQYQPEKNLEKMEVFIKKASGKADIIIFPEDFLSGGLNDDEIVKLADTEGKYRKIFQNFAKKYKIDIVAGSIIEKNRIGNFNVCYYVDSIGKIKGKYKKINLWLTERKQIVPGNEVCVFNTKFGKVGLAICWDLIFPEIFRKMVKKGANIIFCPSLWYKGKDFAPYKKHNPNAEIDHVNALCKARAIENNVIFIYANAIGQLKTSGGNLDEAIGQSQIAVPIKGVLQKLDNEENMFIQEVDTAILKDTEKAYEIRKDLKRRILY